MEESSVVGRRSCLEPAAEELSAPEGEEGRRGDRGVTLARPGVDQGMPEGVRPGSDLKSSRE